VNDELTTKLNTMAAGIREKHAQAIEAAQSAEYWADAICAEYRKSVDHIIETGRLLIEAKAQLKHGEWGRLTGETVDDGRGLLPFSCGTARKFMAIAKDERNRSHVNDLPASWGTCYELTKLTDDQWETGFRLGIINPEMERQDIAQLTGNTILATLHTGDEESYTPAIYIKSARRVLGGIDLDPASNVQAQATVRAARFFTVKDDGLSRDWSGRVWMNPPYTARVINDFMAKLCESFERGAVTTAIALTNNNTDTSWFHNSMEVASAVCFTRGRINFMKPDGSTSSPTNGQMFFYFGNNRDAFTAEFQQHGHVVASCHTTKSRAAIFSRFC